MPHSDLNPYAFGYAVGLRAEKQALAANDFNPFDSNNMVARGVGYMIPGVSTALAAQDLYHNVSQGNVLGSIGSAGMMALGLIPGAGLLGGAAKGLARGGRALMGGGRVAQTVGKGLTAAAEGSMAASRGLVAANRGAKSVNNAMSEGIQKISPLSQTNWTKVGPMHVPLNPLKSTANAVKRNPLLTMGYTMSSGPPVETPPTPGVAPNVASQLPMTPPPAPMPPPMPMPKPPSGPFRPQPLVNFAN
jgi:hypothetical protein